MNDSRRLQFRKYTWEDLSFLYSMTSNPAMMKYIGQGVPWTLEETKMRLERFIERYDEGEGIGLMVLLNKQGGVPIGHAGLVPQQVEGKTETEVGYWIRQDYWGQGFAVEAACACRDFGLLELGKRRLISIIQHNNAGSIRVAHKVGMTYERDAVFQSKRIALYAMEKSFVYGEEA